ncbi:MAG: hypothetical protein LBB72_05955 [Spirochaetaceae bacterium]|jgi:hypothetical protein|nr:hypothetical protein [Spirochaetaceae bacterium]
MVKKTVWLGILAIVLVFGMTIVGCDNGSGNGNDNGATNGSSNGTFTLTGIPSQYNGKYAFLQGYWDMEGTGYMVGVQTLNMPEETYTLPVISNGSVSMPLWCNLDTEPTRPSGSFMYGEIWIQIRDAETYIITSSYEDPAINTVFFYAVNFTNGSATKDWSTGQSE